MEWLHTYNFKVTAIVILKFLQPLSSIVWNDYILNIFFVTCFMVAGHKNHRQKCRLIQKSLLILLKINKSTFNMILIITLIGYFTPRSCLQMKTCDLLICQSGWKLKKMPWNEFVCKQSLEFGDEYWAPGLI